MPPGSGWVSRCRIGVIFDFVKNYTKFRLTFVSEV
jgi:hypothetical protein